MGRLFGSGEGGKRRVTPEELGKQLSAVALQSGFSGAQSVQAELGAAGLDPPADLLRFRLEVIAFTAAPLEMALVMEHPAGKASAARQALVRHLVQALKQSVQPEYRERVPWDAYSDSLSMRISEYFSLMTEEGGSGESLRRLSFRAYQNISDHETVDPMIAMQLGARYGMMVKHMRQAVAAYSLS